MDINKFKIKPIPQQMAQKIETPILQFVVANVACIPQRIQIIKSKIAIIR